MAVLTEAQRKKVWRMLMEAGHAPSAITKVDARAAVNAIDDWIDGAGAALINTEFPQPFKAEATTAQKAIILAYVALQRAGVL